jgi:hypothetical protein
VLGCPVAVAAASVFAPGTAFTLPERAGARSHTAAPRPQAGARVQAHRPAGTRAPADCHIPGRARRPAHHLAVRVPACPCAGALAEGAERQPSEGWLICDWAKDHDEPLDYWISNLPADTPHEQLARLSRMRWQIELDYKQLKGELGLDHYEGRSWLGWYHHTPLGTAAHRFLTLERQNPNRQRPA